MTWSPDILVGKQGLLAVPERKVHELHRPGAGGRPSPDHAPVHARISVLWNCLQLAFTPPG